MFTSEESEEQKLRALWTLHVIDGLTESRLLALLDHPQQHVRKWAVYLLMDEGSVSVAASRRMAEMAVGEKSQPVRLAQVTMARHSCNRSRGKSSDSARGTSNH